VWLNMFQVLLRPLSEAYNCISSLWFYCWSVVVAALLVVVCQTTTNNAVTTNAPTVKPDAVNAVVSSWWWAWRRPKHVERHINLWNCCI
jgi:hypothetical protein